MVDLSLLDLNREIGKLLSAQVALKIEGICIGQPTDNSLTVATVDPSEVSYYELIELDTGHRYKAQLIGATKEQILLAQEFTYKVSPAQAGLTWKEWLEAKRFHFDSLGLPNKAPGAREVTGQVVELADRLIKEAISVRASDIHVECYPDYSLIRFRQDGTLRLIDKLDSALGQSLINRLKVMGNLDVTQDRITQGGRISLELGGRGYDLRVSLVPVPGGESMVLRVLNKGAFDTTLGELGFHDEQFKLYSHMLQHPHGLLLTCGPTGSGKSTTLYASLKTIQRPDRKLLTVEDPIEYEMPEIVQVQVNRAAREADRQVTFASTLREFLRHDPDVILVGEIRDEETAHISIQAALTGHLVLSTLHTNDSVGVIYRLRDQKIPSYLVASTLIGGVAQRLVRRLCTNCRAAVETDAREAELLKKHGQPEERLWQSKGCDVCHHTGFRGRVAIYETLRITQEIRELIEKESIASEVWRVALQQGMKTLLDSGLQKATDGTTSLAEVARVCSLDLT